jgi:hypothetical protein
LEKYVEKISANPENYNTIARINLNDYPNIEFYLNMAHATDRTDYKRLTQEIQVFVNTVKDILPYTQYKQLIDETNNFADTEKVTYFINEYFKKYPENYAKYRELSKLVKINELVKALNPVELITERRQLTEKIKFALSYDNTEAEIAFITDFIRYFRDYLTASLMQDDWTYVKANMEQFKEIFGKYAAYNALKEVESDLAEITEYYDVNTDRNNIFLSNLLTSTGAAERLEKQEDGLTLSSSVQDILSNAQDVKIVITGGYHSESLKELFADKNISSMVITPNVTTDIKRAQTKYMEIVKEQAKFPTNALAAILLSGTSNTYQVAKIFQASVNAGLNQPDIEKLIRDFDLSERVKIDGGNIVVDGKESVSLTKKSVGQSQIDKGFDLLKTVNIASNFSFDNLETETLKTVGAVLTHFGAGEAAIIKEVEEANLGEAEFIAGVEMTKFNYYPAFIQQMLLNKEIANNRNAGTASDIEDGIDFSNAENKEALSALTKKLMSDSEDKTVAGYDIMITNSPEGIAPYVSDVVNVLIRKDGSTAINVFGKKGLVDVRTEEDIKKYIEESYKGERKIEDLTSEVVSCLTDLINESKGIKTGKKIISSAEDMKALFREWFPKSGARLYDYLDFDQDIGGYLGKTAAFAYEMFNNLYMGANMDHESDVKFKNERLQKILESAGIENYEKYMFDNDDSGLEKFFGFLDNDSEKIQNFFDDNAGKLSVKIIAKFEYLGRDFVEIEYPNGQKFLFYTSSYGTGTKIKSVWYPIGGFTKYKGFLNRSATQHWFVKTDNIDKFYHKEVFEATSKALQNLDIKTTESFDISKSAEKGAPLSIGGRLKDFIVRLFPKKGARFYDVYLAPLMEAGNIAAVASAAGEQTKKWFLGQHAAYNDALAIVEDFRQQVKDAETTETDAKDFLALRFPERLKDIEEAEKIIAEFEKGLDSIVGAAEVAYKEAISKGKGIRYALTKAAIASIRPHMKWNNGQWNEKDENSRAALSAEDEDPGLKSSLMTLGYDINDFSDEEIKMLKAILKLGLNLNKSTVWLAKYYVIPTTTKKEEKDRIKNLEKYINEDWFKELYSGKYLNVGGLSNGQIEEISVLSSFGLTLNQSIVDFAKITGAGRIEFLEGLEEYKNEDWFKDLFSGNHDITRLTPNNIKRLGVICSSGLGLKVNPATIAFAKKDFGGLEKFEKDIKDLKPYKDEEWFQQLFYNEKYYKYAGELTVDRIKKIEQLLSFMELDKRLGSLNEQIVYSAINYMLPSNNYGNLLEDYKYKLELPKMFLGTDGEMYYIDNLEIGRAVQKLYKFINMGDGATYGIRPVIEDKGGLKTITSLEVYAKEAGASGKLPESSVTIKYEQGYWPSSLVGTVKTFSLLKEGLTFRSILSGVGTFSVEKTVQDGKIIIVETEILIGKEYDGKIVNAHFRDGKFAYVDTEEKIIYGLSRRNVTDKTYDTRPQKIIVEELDENNRKIGKPIEYRGIEVPPAAKKKLTSSGKYKVYGDITVRKAGGFGFKFFNKSIILSQKEATGERIELLVEDGKITRISIDGEITRISIDGELVKIAENNVEQKDSKAFAATKIIAYYDVPNSELAQRVKQRQEDEVYDVKNSELAQRAKQWQEDEVTVLVVRDSDKIAGKGTGIKIKGINVRIQNVNGQIVVLAKGADYEDVVKKIHNNKMINKFANKLRSEIKKKGFNLKNISFEGLITDETMAEEDIGFVGDIIKVNKKRYDAEKLKGNESFGLYLHNAMEIARSFKEAKADKAVMDFTKENSGEVINILEKLLKKGFYTSLKIAVSGSDADTIANNVDLFELRRLGVEVYAFDSGLSADFGKMGFNGRINTNTQELYEYASGLAFEIEKVGTEDEIAKKLNEAKGFVLIEPALISKSDSRNPIGKMNELNALFGKLKLNFGLLGINYGEAVNMAYRLDLDDMPVIENLTAQQAQTAISLLSSNHQITTLLNAIKKNLNEKEQKSINAIITERILTANFLSAKAPEAGKKSVIADKEMEIMLGKALYKLNGEEIIPDVKFAARQHYNDYIIQESKKSDKKSAANVATVIFTYHGIAIDINKYKERISDSNRQAGYRAILTAA